MTGWSVTRHEDVRAVLTDPAFRVPAVDGGPPGTLAWLRGTVSRFSPPEWHAERRAIGVAALAGLDPDELRREAARLSAAALDRAGDRLDVMDRLARRVPVRVLAVQLGLADPDAAVAEVAAVAAAYHPGADPVLIATGRPGGRGAAGTLPAGAAGGAGEPDRPAGPGVRRHVPD